MEENKSKNCNAKELPTQQYLIECFGYEPEVGDLIWKIRPREHFETKQGWSYFNNNVAGTIAGSKTSPRHIHLKLDGIGCKAHRIIWKMIYGIEPTYVIDHIDGDSKNNKLNNLRDIPQEMNMKNRKVGKLNKSGYLGVHFCNKSKRWRAELNFNRKKTFLGHFITEELAALEHELKYREAVGEEFYNESGRDKILEEIQEKIKNSENTINNNLAIKNTTGYTGVSLAKHGRYKSAIKIKENDKQKELFLGYYDTVEEAALMRELKLKELKGDEYYTSRGRDGLLKDLEEKVKTIKGL